MPSIRPSLVSLTLMLALVAGCGKKAVDLQKFQPEVDSVVEHYRQSAFETYRDTAKKTHLLRSKIDAFLAQPSAKGLNDARELWKTAHAAYVQTAPFWINHDQASTKALHQRIAPPLVEPGRIDIVQGAPRSGLIHNPGTGFKDITQETLISGHNPGQGNVVLGFHVLEFLLWGEDVYPDTGGYRPFIDFTITESADRRGTMLRAVIGQLAYDIQSLSDQWHPSAQDKLSERVTRLPDNHAMRLVMNGLINATNVGLIQAVRAPLSSMNQADESSNFSDTSNEDLLNTFNSIENVLLGKSATGKAASVSLISLLEKSRPPLADQLKAKLKEVRTAVTNPQETFDQMILQKNSAGRSILERLAVLAEEQGKLLQEAAEALSS